MVTSNDELTHSCKGEESDGRSGQTGSVSACVLTWPPKVEILLRRHCTESLRAGKPTNFHNKPDGIEKVSWARHRGRQTFAEQGGADHVENALLHWDRSA